MPIAELITPRHLAILQLSEDRGRKRPLNPTTISKWSADLGFEAYQRGFSPAEMELLRFVNDHYASGGTRRELLEQLKARRSTVHVCR